MKQSDESNYVIPIMNHFDCNKEMAELIIKSYKANGNYESIKYLCEQERSKEHGNR